MKYIPELTEQEIEENNKHFKERITLYKHKGLDFFKARSFILQKAKPLEGNILEIGTGTGHTTLCLAKAGHRFASVDPDKETLKIAALNVAYEGMLSNVDFYVMDGMSLAFGDNSFNNIIIVCLFHHIDDISRILKETDRVLVPGGKVVISDFDRYGMEIVNTVHEEEGRKHEDSGVTGKDIRDYLDALEYNTKSYDYKGYWIVIGEKAK